MSQLEEKDAECGEPKWKKGALAKRCSKLSPLEEVLKRERAKSRANSDMKKNLDSARKQLAMMAATVEAK